jgi:hypothetical protein
MILKLQSLSKTEYINIINIDHLSIPMTPDNAGDYLIEILYKGSNNTISFYVKEPEKTKLITEYEKIIK